MLKEFIEHIQETTKPSIFEKDGETFVIRAGGEANQLRPVIDRADTLALTSLDAMVKMIQSEGLKIQTPLYITVPNHLTVRCFGKVQTESRQYRQEYYTAKATDVPGWEPESKLGFEEAQIALRTRFQGTQDTTYALKLVSDITCGAKVVYNDNGIATTVTTQKGIALQENAQVRPLISLKPYRTFQEVDQPESIFLIRISERGISFIEADGGMWKLRAREIIKAFLEDRLSEELDRGDVIIAL